MSQTGFTPIQLYYSTTASTAPTAGNLANGELAINITDGKLYYKDNGGVVQVLATKGAGTVGGSNTQVQYNSSGALAGSANLTFDGTYLGIGQATPTSRLHISGAAFGATTQVLIESTSTSGSNNGSLVFNRTTTSAISSEISGAIYWNRTLTDSSANTAAQIYAIGSNDSVTPSATLIYDSFTSHAWRINSSEQMRLTSTGLGIGTSSPVSKLDVNGSVNISSVGNLTWGGAYGAGIPTIAVPSAGSLGFYPNGSTSGLSMVLNSAGNLGIGTSSPATKLDVNGSINIVSGNNLTWGGAYGANIPAIYAVSGASGYIQFDPRGSSVAGMKLDASGNLGLGVTPSAWGYSGTAALQIKNAGFAGLNNNTYITSNAYINSSGTYSYIASDFATLVRNTSGKHEWYTAPSGTAGTAVTFTQAMTLDASGNLLVGQTATGYQNSKSAYIGSGAFIMSHSSTNVSGDTYIGFGYNTSQIGSINQSGTTGVLYNITSDQRMKENIVDADSASSLIDNLQVRQYDWKADGSHQRYGFIAQELVIVAPEAVHQPADPEAMMGVDYSKLVPMLVKEIQSLRKRLAYAGIA